MIFSLSFLYHSYFHFIQFLTYFIKQNSPCGLIVHQSLSARIQYNKCVQKKSCNNTEKRTLKERREKNEQTFISIFNLNRNYMVLNDSLDICTRTAMGNDDDAAEFILFY